MLKVVQLSEILVASAKNQILIVRKCNLIATKHMSKLP